MKEKIEDIIYNVLDFLINNRWASALTFVLSMGFIAYFILYPINKQIAFGFVGGAIGTLFYSFIKTKDNEY